MLILEASAGRLEIQRLPRHCRRSRFSDSLPDLGAWRMPCACVHAPAWQVADRNRRRLSSFNAAESHTLKEFHARPVRNATRRNTRAREVYEVSCQCLLHRLNQRADTYSEGRDEAHAGSGHRSRWTLLTLRGACRGSRSAAGRKPCPSFRRPALHWWPDRALLKAGSTSPTPARELDTTPTRGK